MSTEPAQADVDPSKSRLMLSCLGSCQCRVERANVDIESSRPEPISIRAGDIESSGPEPMSSQGVLSQCRAGLGQCRAERVRVDVELSGPKPMLS